MCGGCGTINPLRKSKLLLGVVNPFGINYQRILRILRMKVIYSHSNTTHLDK